ncbi:MAG: hypothetical protein U5K81_04205 [Trueperaceae bacterium]|nr:hypothetical protein [Trueperaceae bacterium]
MGTKNERDRIRIEHGRYDVNGYSWLRPADPRSIVFTSATSPELTYITKRKDGTPRERAPRVDEAQGILDIQYPIDDLPTFDHENRRAHRFYFDPNRLLLTLTPGQQSEPIDVATTRQHIGVRHWWICPHCQHNKRLLYYFDARHLGAPNRAESALACSDCLGLTYRSRAHHRTPAQDRRDAARGNPDAAARLQRRREKRIAKISARRRRNKTTLRKLLDKMGGLSPRRP